jgi:hypothetical protein
MLLSVLTPSLNAVLERISKLAPRRQTRDVVGQAPDNPARPAGLKKEGVYARQKAYRCLAPFDLALPLELPATGIRYKGVVP